VVNRIAGEIADFHESLSCEPTNGFFVRYDEEACDFMKVLVTGVAGTPYAGGCFVFDVYCSPRYANDFPSNLLIFHRGLLGKAAGSRHRPPWAGLRCDLSSSPRGVTSQKVEKPNHFEVLFDPKHFRYGQQPPRLLLETTGSNTMRFSPNLYRSGKVCLSLLGTWEGSEPGETWSTGSSLLQVLVSIQSMVMTSRPIECEPGEQGHGAAADAKNAGYVAIIRYGTVRHAMLGQLEQPSPLFASAIRKHFAVVKEAVLTAVRGWVDEAPVGAFAAGSFDGIVREHNPELCRLFDAPGAYRTRMEALAARLERALAAL
jgi:ubiquitin-protein ligase